MARNLHVYDKVGIAFIVLLSIGLVTTIQLYCSSAVWLLENGSIRFNNLIYANIGSVWILLKPTFFRLRLLLSIFLNI